MVVVNINDGLTNSIMTKRKLQAMERELINEEYVPQKPDNNVIDVESSTPGEDK